MRRLLALLLFICTPAFAQPVTLSGTISSTNDYICFDMKGNTSVRMSITGTFVANWMVTAWNDPSCSVGGQVAHHADTFYGQRFSVSPLNNPSSSGTGVYVIPDLDGVQSVKLQIYTATGGGYQSGTINAHFSATMARSATAPLTGGHHEGGRVASGQTGRTMNTRASCSYPASPCSPPAFGNFGATNSLVLHAALSQTTCVRGIYVTAYDVPWTGRIRIIDGSDGEAIDFGIHTISPTGPAWERIGSPLFCGDGGNDVVIEASGSPGARTKIQAVADR